MIDFSVSYVQKHRSHIFIIQASTVFLFLDVGYSAKLKNRVNMINQRDARQRKPKQPTWGNHFSCNPLSKGKSREQSLKWCISDARCDSQVFVRTLHGCTLSSLWAKESRVQLGLARASGKVWSEETIGLRLDPDTTTYFWHNSFGLCQKYASYFLRYNHC